MVSLRVIVASQLMLCRGSGDECLFKGITVGLDFCALKSRLVPIQWFRRIPSGPIVFHIVILGYWPSEEIGLGGHKVFVLDDGWGDENNQVALLALLGLAAESVTEQRDVAEHRHFGVLIAHIVLNEATQHERIAAGNHDPGF